MAVNMAVRERLGPWPANMGVRERLGPWPLTWPLGNGALTYFGHESLRLLDISSLGLRCLGLRCEHLSELFEIDLNKKNREPGRLGLPGRPQGVFNSEGVGPSSCGGLLPPPVPNRRPPIGRFVWMTQRHRAHSGIAHSSPHNPGN